MQQSFGSGGIRQIAFVGPFGVGKTTAVRTISETAVLETEAASSTALATGRRIKPTTTVGLEYGDWTAPDGGRIDIVGTPGQDRFDLVRRSAFGLSKGVVAWLFGHHAAAQEDCVLWLKRLQDEDVPASRLTVAITRIPNTPEALAPFRGLVDQFAGVDVPVVAADPRDRADVENVLLTTVKRTMHLGVKE